MDKVRKIERKEHAELDKLIKLFPTLGEAYRLKELFNDLWEMETEEAIAFLVSWCNEVDETKIHSFQEFVKMDGSLVWSY